MFSKKGKSRKATSAERAAENLLLGVWIHSSFIFTPAAGKTLSFFSTDLFPHFRLRKTNTYVSRILAVSEDPAERPDGAWAV